MTRSDVREITLGGVVFTADPHDSLTWIYLPLSPSPQRGPDGSPMLHLLDSGSHGFLQISAQLDPYGDDLETMRTALLEQLETSVVRLRSAVDHPLAVQLKLGGTVIGETTSSGYAPHTAAMSASVSGEQLTDVRSALDGRVDRLIIEFTSPRQTDATARADIALWAQPAARPPAMPDRTTSGTPKDCSC